MTLTRNERCKAHLVIERCHDIRAKYERIGEPSMADIASTLAAQCQRALNTNERSPVQAIFAPLVWGRP